MIESVLAIDPGYKKSAFVRYDGASVIDKAIVSNDHMIGVLMLMAVLDDRKVVTHLVIEQIEGYGMAVGKEVFETVFWSGRFAQAWYCGGMKDVYRVTRREVKLHLCGQTRAKDANVRQALIDRFGPGKQRAIGLKKTPGPLYGMKSDMWAALAVAVTWWDECPHHHGNGSRTLREVDLS